jgi:hypothetical protein
LIQVIADVAVLSTDSVAVVEESWQGDTLPPDVDTVAKEVVAVEIAEVETITEKEDEDEKEFDPYLQYGGVYYEDDKNNRFEALPLTILYSCCVSIHLHVLQ